MQVPRASPARARRRATNARARPPVRTRSPRRPEIAAARSAATSPLRRLQARRPFSKPSRATRVSETCTSGSVVTADAGATTGRRAHGRRRQRWRGNADREQRRRAPVAGRVARPESDRVLARPKLRESGYEVFGGGVEASRRRPASADLSRPRDPHRPTVRRRRSARSRRWHVPGPAHRQRRGSRARAG